MYSKDLVKFVEQRMAGLTKDLIKRGVLTSDAMIDYVEEKIKSTLQELKTVNQ